MKKIMQNRILLGCFSILIAAILCFGVAPFISQLNGEEISVPVLKTAITKGSIITESDLDFINVPNQYMPTGTVKAASNIVGKYATTDLVSGEYVYAEKLSVTPTVQSTWTQMVNAENVAVSVTIKSFAAGLSGKLEPNDIISFIAAKNTGAGETQIPELLQYVKVIAVTTDTAKEYDAQDAETETLPSTVTVLVSPEQATLLADLELNSTLYNALVCRGDIEKSTQLLDMQKQVTSIVEEVPNNG